MEKRRGISARPASSEEQECWSQAAKSLKTLAGIYNNSKAIQTIDRVNRLISVWPEDDNLPAEGLDSVKVTYTRLVAGLTEIQSSAQAEAKALEDAMEKLDVVTALRKASEALPPSEKRMKRPRAPSPSAIPTPATSTPVSRGVSITLPARVGAAALAHIPQSRREFLNKQLPLMPGRQVAFLPPGADNTWILAVVIKRLSIDHEYMVKDPDPEDGIEKTYKATLKNLIPLPDQQALPNTPGHLNSYPEFPTRSNVLALYPDTTTFYQAVVLAPPKELHPPKGAPSSKYMPTYRVQFEDDDGLEHSIPAHLVVDWPEQ